MDNFQSPAELVARVSKRIEEMREERARVEAVLPDARAEAEALARPVREAFAARQALTPALPEGAVSTQVYVYRSADIARAEAAIAKAKLPYTDAYDRVQRLRSRREQLYQNEMQAEALIAQIQRQIDLQEADLAGTPPSRRSRLASAVSAIASALSPGEEQLAERQRLRDARTAKALSAREAE